MPTLNPGPVVIDVEGLALTVDDRRRIADPLTGGVILFARNFSSRRQLCALTAQIKAVRTDVLIAIDHEGGRVQRCKTDGFTHLPAMRRLGELWDRDVLAATRAATAAGYVLAAELRACGVDYSFTPVLDLDYGHSAVIGNRAFHADPRVVVLLAKSLNHGLLLAGMQNCGKHFPGHGYVDADSHIAIPVDRRGLDEILAKDATPYDWLGASLSAVMPAHVIYPQVDPNPAGFSKFWLQDVLRGRYRFDGVIFSDDLTMEGASVAGTIDRAAKAALNAGCDMVLVCNAPAKADLLLSALSGFWNKFPAEKKKASQQRIVKLLPQSPAPAWQALQATAEYRHALDLLRTHALIA